MTFPEGGGIHLALLPVISAPDEGNPGKRAFADSPCDPVGQMPPLRDAANAGMDGRVPPNVLRDRQTIGKMRSLRWTSGPDRRRELTGCRPSAARIRIIPSEQVDPATLRRQQALENRAVYPQRFEAVDHSESV